MLELQVLKASLKLTKLIYDLWFPQVDDQDFYSFPSFSALTGHNLETELRQLGFGYRAKFIASIAKSICNEKEENWLYSLRDCSYLEAKKELMTLMGVGAKVGVLVYKLVFF